MFERITKHFLKATQNAYMYMYVPFDTKSSRCFKMATNASQLDHTGEDFGMVKDTVYIPTTDTYITLKRGEAMNSGTDRINVLLEVETF